MLHLKLSHPWSPLMWFFWPVIELRGMSESEAVWTQTHCGLGGTRERGGEKHGTCFDLSLLFMGNSFELTITKSPVSSTGIDIPPVNAIFIRILMNNVHSGLLKENIPLLFFLIAYLAGVVLRNKHCVVYRMHAHWPFCVIQCIRVQWSQLKNV